MNRTEIEAEAARIINSNCHDASRLSRLAALRVQWREAAPAVHGSYDHETWSYRHGRKTLVPSVRDECIVCGTGSEDRSYG